MPSHIGFCKNINSYSDNTVIAIDMEKLIKFKINNVSNMVKPGCVIQIQSSWKGG
jgi:hypothetical protein